MTINDDLERARLRHEAENWRNSYLVTTDFISKLMSLLQVGDWQNLPNAITNLKAQNLERWNRIESLVRDNHTLATERDQLKKDKQAQAEIIKELVAEREQWFAAAGVKYPQVFATRLSVLLAQEKVLNGVQDALKGRPGAGAVVPNAPYIEATGTYTKPATMGIDWAKPGATQDPMNIPQTLKRR